MVSTNDIQLDPTLTHLMVSTNDIQLDPTAHTPDGQHQ